MRRTRPQPSPAQPSPGSLRAAAARRWPEFTLIGILGLFAVSAQ